MTLLGDIIDELDRWYPPASAESWDAVGLVCGDRDQPVGRILLAIDVVPATVEQAISAGAQLLLTHHPLFLTAVHAVPAAEPKGALLQRLIRTSTAHFVAHTNAEVTSPGVSDALAEVFGLQNIRPLEPHPTQAGNGAGRIGDLPLPVSFLDFAASVAQHLPATVWGVRAAGEPDQLVQRVGVLAGSGSSLVDAARAAGADVYLTADLKHHNGVEAVNQRAGTPMALVDAAHWATERPWLDALARRLRTSFGTTVDIVVSDLVTDPWTLHQPSPSPISESR